MLTIPKDASVVVLTGAGISVASGLSPFRGPGGIWNDIDVEETISAHAWWPPTARPTTHGLFVQTGPVSGVPVSAGCVSGLPESNGGFC